MVIFLYKLYIFIWMHHFWSPFINHFTYIVIYTSMFVYSSFELSYLKPGYNEQYSKKDPMNLQRASQTSKNEIPNIPKIKICKNNQDLLSIS